MVDLATYQNIPAQFKGKPLIPDFDPKEFTSNNIVFDSFERDLTMNAIYYDMKTEEVVTFHGGIHDLRDCRLDTIVDADLEFTVNPAAAIRVLRFRARYGYMFSDRIEKDLREHTKDYMKLLTPETSAFQQQKMWDTDYTYDCYRILSEYGALPVLFPSVASIYMKADYRHYVTEHLKHVDVSMSTESKDYKISPIAIILYPAVSAQVASTGLDQAIATVLNAQAAIYDFNSNKDRTIIETDLKTLYQEATATPAPAPASPEPSTSATIKVGGKNVTKAALKLTVKYSDLKKKAKSYKVTRQGKGNFGLMAVFVTPTRQESAVP